jgi:hypothetical protein
LKVLAGSSSVEGEVGRAIKRGLLVDGVDVGSGFGWKAKETRSTSLSPSEFLKFEQKKKRCPIIANGL